MVNGPFKTGNEPTSITIDPRGILYLPHQLAGSDSFVLLHFAAHRHAYRQS